MDSRSNMLIKYSKLLSKINNPIIICLAMYSSGTIRNNLLRRGSVQANKPPPPIRRTSSITNTSVIGQQLTSMGSFEHLPPPPAFLLEPNQQQQQNQQKLSTGEQIIHTSKSVC